MATAIQRRWVAVVLVMAACVGTGALVVREFVLRTYVIDSASMSPTLDVGDRAVVDVRAGQPLRGSVVAFDGHSSLSPGEHRTFVKRVIGLGGDRVSCCVRGRLTRNGDPLVESYLAGAGTASEVEFDVIVEPGTMWVMGDNRDRSEDSRALLGRPGGGMVPVQDVLGQVKHRVWPWEEVR